MAAVDMEEVAGVVLPVRASDRTATRIEEGIEFDGGPPQGPTLSPGEAMGSQASRLLRLPRFAESTTGCISQVVRLDPVE